MRYGAEAARVRALADLFEDPQQALQPVAAHTSVAPVDIAHAFLHEGAKDTGDVIERRLRLDAVDADLPAARAAVDEVLEVRQVREVLHERGPAGAVPAGAN